MVLGGNLSPKRLVNRDCPRQRSADDNTRFPANALSDALVRAVHCGPHGSKYLVKRVESQCNSIGASAITGINSSLKIHADTFLHPTARRFINSPLDPCSRRWRKTTDEKHSFRHANVHYLQALLLPTASVGEKKTILWLKNNWL